MYVLKGRYADKSQNPQMGAKVWSNIYVINVFFYVSLQFQNVPDTMLQEEVRKLHIALSEERKVTEKLSRNLELEKRRSESLEQKAKNAFRKSSQANTSNTAVFLPEEMRYRDEQLADKMEKYTDQIERVTMSLQECEEKLTGFEIQVKISGLPIFDYFF